MSPPAGNRATRCRSGTRFRTASSDLRTARTLRSPGSAFSVTPTQTRSSPASAALEAGHRRRHLRGRNCREVEHDPVTFTSRAEASAHGVEGGSLARGEGARLPQPVGRGQRGMPAQGYLGDWGEPAQVEAPPSPGARNAVSACCSSLATPCIHSTSRRASSKSTPAGLPEKRRAVVKASTSAKALPPGHRPPPARRLTTECDACWNGSAAVANRT